MRKVCIHNWANTVDNCNPDYQGNCVYVADHEHVVCHHTQFQSECGLLVKCKIDGINCFIKDRASTVVRRDGAPLADGDRLDGKMVLMRNRSFEHGNWGATAVIVMDMWNTHPCSIAVDRINELAPALNQFLEFARKQGALIIHSPSGCGYYSDPSNISDAERAERAARTNALNAWKPIQFRAPSFYLGDATNVDGNIIGFDLIVGSNCPDSEESWIRCSPKGKSPTGNPTRIHPGIRVDPLDAISADELRPSRPHWDHDYALSETIWLTEARPNIIFCGVHTNWCILRRSNAMRAMYKAGKSLWLVSDLTDSFTSDPTVGYTAYACELDSYAPPPPSGSGSYTYSHAQANKMVVDWIGRHLNADTLPSNSVMGGQPFSFSG